MAQPSNQTLKAGRFTTHVNLSGDDKGEALLFLHGSGPGASAWSNWQFALPVLGDLFRCIAPPCSTLLSSNGSAEKRRHIREAVEADATEGKHQVLHPLREGVVPILDTRDG